ncbi:MAG TPA: erythromycin esterase family protein [Thermoanaerobaculia bacterium]|nr:erythromycin esterase family protein [Thermoanaerobaculia bacterium]
MKRSRALSALFTAALVFGVSAGISPAWAQNVSDPVRPGVWRLDGMDPDLPFHDLEPLRQIVGTAQVVGLGETFHTSGGYYTMKHRVFRFLVEEMGFRAFAFESNWIDAEQTARYVATCQGTPEEGTAGLFGVWESEETADLLQWMCEWNRGHSRAADKVHFFGFDVQQPEDDGPALIQFLVEQGLEEDDPRILGLRKCDGVETSVWPKPVPNSTHRACVRALDQVDQLLKRLDPSEAVQPARAAVEWAKINALGLRAWEDEAYYEKRNPWRSFEARDRGMATAFQRIRKLKVGAAKTAIWAHNSHIAKQSRLTLEVTTMGTFLEKPLGHNYANIALTSVRPSINWQALGRCGLVPPMADSLEKRLETLNMDYALVDFDFPGAIEPFLPDANMWIGQRWNAPRRQYDGAIYLEESPMMTPLRWPATCP